MVDILNRLLPGDNVPCSCNSFLDSTLFSTSWSRIAVVDTHLFLEQEKSLVHCCRRNILEEMPLAFAQMLREILRRPFERQPRAVLRYRWDLLSPTQ